MGIHLSRIVGGSERRNLRGHFEKTDPGVPLHHPSQSPDVYLPPPEEGGETEPAKTKTGAPARKTWFGRFWERRQGLAEAREIVAKIDLLPTASERSIRYFVDHDFPKLPTLSRKHPKEIALLLKEARQNATDWERSEPWFCLIETACGDHDAFLRGIEILC